MMEIAAALSGLKAAIDITKGLIGARDAGNIKDAFSDITEKMLDVNTTSLAIQERAQALSQETASLTERVRALEEELRQVSDHKTELEKYAPHHTARGGLCLIDKASMGSNEQAIYLCINCSARRQITYLQLTKSNTLLSCNEHGDIGSDVPYPTEEHYQANIRRAIRRI